jgi:hypothetical protein
MNNVLDIAHHVGLLKTHVSEIRSVSIFMCGGEKKILPCWAQ